MKKILNLIDAIIHEDGDKLHEGSIVSLRLIREEAIRLSNHQSENESLKKVNAELRTALDMGIMDMENWLDYNVLQVDSFRGSEKQMMLDLCEDIKERIKKAKEAISKATKQ